MCVDEIAVIYLLKYHIRDNHGCELMRVLQTMNNALKTRSYTEKKSDQPSIFNVYVNEDF